MAEHLSISVDEFTDAYAGRHVAGWAQLKDRGEGDDACVFLSRSVLHFSLPLLSDEAGDENQVHVVNGIVARAFLSL